MRTSAMFERDPITTAELEHRLAGVARESAEDASASADPLLGRVAAATQYNRYTIQLLADAGLGQAPGEVSGATIEAINIAEPFDAPGETELGLVVLCWPSQGLWLFAASVDEPAATSSHWAKVTGGNGPGYIVRRQVASGASAFADAPGAGEVSAVNTWELTVDAGATADVPAGAVVRIFEEDDNGDPPTVRRFFTYPIHAVYR